MKDKSWLLNPAAIAAAKACIGAVETELGVKLKLSHPQFLEMIEQYCELTDSAMMNESYQALKIFSQGVDEMTSVSKKVVSLNNAEPPSGSRVSKTITKEQDFVTFKGRSYRRFDDEGHEFKGLYRGQARYA